MNVKVLFGIFVALIPCGAIAQMGTEDFTRSAYGDYETCAIKNAIELEKAGEAIPRTVQAAILKCDKPKFDLDWAIVQQVEQEFWKERESGDAITAEIKVRENRMHQWASNAATLRLFDIRAKVK